MGLSPDDSQTQSSGWVTCESLRASIWWQMVSGAASQRPISRICARHSGRGRKTCDRGVGFGHEPLGDRAKTLLKAYAHDALVAGRYDFHMGRKLRDHLERSGFTVSKLLTLNDQELSFSGPARPEVLDEWRSRFDRMQLLRDFCGAAFDQVREEFLGCLMRTNHRSVATVYCCIATK